MNNFRVYNPLNLNHPAIQNRSYLYQISPIGIGTPYVESLTSLITRLAEAHCVSPRLLISKIITPYLTKIFLKNKDSRDLKVFFNHSQALNSYENMALDFIQALEKLSLQKEFKFLTLMTWKNLLIQKGLLREKKAWCPLCYEERRNSKTNFYDPLL